MPLPADPVGRKLFLTVGRDRYQRWLAREVQSILLKAFNETAGLLLNEFSDITPFQKARRKQLFASIAQLLADSYDEASVFHVGEMKKYAQFESRVSITDLRNLIDLGGGTDAGLSFSVLGAQKVKAIVELPISGLGIGDWWEKQVNDMSTRMRQQVQLGLLQGEDAAKIVKRIIPTPGPDATPVLYKQGARNADYLVRTMLTGVENAASVATMEALDPDVTDSYRYTATRDSRTSAICAALDGRVFKYSDPARKMPPQHINCRSTTVPIVNYKKLGLTQVMTKDAYNMGSFSKWFTRADASVQDSLFGPTRGDMLRAGKITLPDLISSDSRVLTLAQLKAFAN